MVLSVRKKLVVGNWKMNGDRARNLALIDGLKGRIPAGVEVAVCPPSPYLAQVQALGEPLGLAVGAQDLSPRKEGAFTGDVAAAMLLDVGCEWVLVGHSERRTLHGEGNGLVAEKVAVALEAGLKPILCVGETLAERDGGQAEEVVRSQVMSVVSLLGADAMARVVVAYEPVWAIGTGRTATPEQAELMHACIRECLEPNRLPGIADLVSQGSHQAQGVVRINLVRLSLVEREQSGRHARPFMPSSFDTTPSCILPPSIRLSSSQWSMMTLWNMLAYSMALRMKSQFST